ncbi:MAG: molybdopterin-dependent oxidoreductase [Coriobacteriales bacterium]|jgi:thiosulfate reductase/polysulfide reductase chain A|nr:molybdopterin-dependent oxidoreductase [Coriobacteriales bacterium]
MNRVNKKRATDTTEQTTGSAEGTQSNPGQANPRNTRVNTAAIPLAPYEVEGGAAIPLAQRCPEKTISRRSFVAAGTGAAVLAGTGCLGLSTLHQAHAADKAAAEASQLPGPLMRHSLCGACSNQCGFTAYIVDGKLTKLVGDKANPGGAGKLCARGYGYATIASSPDRLTHPLKRNLDGSFSQITWTQAYSEISEKLMSLIDVQGAEAVALMHSLHPSVSFYGRRFMAALGSPNVYAYDPPGNLSRNSGFAQVFGADTFLADIAHARLVMFVGGDPAEAVLPATLSAMQSARKSGGRIVVVDPRLTTSAIFADEWLPINPGTELAFLLSMAHVLVRLNRYDQDFIAQHTVGFEEWAEKLSQYTPQWAEEITGIPAETISRLAGEFAEKAPASVIDSAWRGVYGCAYQNSGETGRVIALFNTLLGNWNQKGGALLYPRATFGQLDATVFPVPTATGERVGDADYPLVWEEAGSSAFAIQAAREGRISAMLFYGSNVVAECPNPDYLTEALDKLDLSVVIDVQMSETAQLAHYVLPDTSYLERLEVPEIVPGKKPTVTLRDKVLDTVYEDTRPVDEIFSELARACNVGAYFTFSVEELADAQLKTVGLDLAALQAVGSAQYEGAPFAYGSLPDIATPTGKFQFSSEACVQAGYPASPEWLPPRVMPTGDRLRLIGGEQALCASTVTIDNPDLMEVIKKYRLTYPWIHATVAQRLGIKDGDEIELTSDIHSGRTRVHVTQAINPTALYLPSYYGCSVKELKEAYNVGLRQMDFVPLHLEMGYGAAMTQEVLVTIKKVGA